MPFKQQNAMEPSQGQPADESRKIPVIEERLVVASERIETGRVLISKAVSQEEAHFNASITSEEVIVERREINQYVDTAPAAVRQEGDVTIISVIKEVLVVEKRVMLVEELHITKRQRQDQQTFSQTLRKEKVTLSRETPGTDIYNTAQVQRK